MLTISQRLTLFFWLSWLCGLLMAGLIGLGLVLFSFLEPSYGGLFTTIRDSPATFLALIILDGLGALLGNVLRQWLMRHVFRRAEAAATPAARLAWLVGGTLLLFVASVLFCQLVFMVFTFNAGIISMLVPLLRLFFILSAPWLLTTSLAACWVCRDWLRPIPVSGTAVSK